MAISHSLVSMLFTHFEKIQKFKKTYLIYYLFLVFIFSSMVLKRFILVMVILYKFK